MMNCIPLSKDNAYEISRLLYSSNKEQLIEVLKNSIKSNGIGKIQRDGIENLIKTVRNPTYENFRTHVPKTRKIDVFGDKQLVIQTLKNYSGSLKIVPAAGTTADLL